MPGSGGHGHSLGPAEEKLLAALTETPTTTRELMDRFVDLHGHGLRRETVSRALNLLSDMGLADRMTEGRDALWFLPPPVDAAQTSAGGDVQGEL